VNRRLLYVVNDAPFFLSHRFALAKAARAAGYDVTVATPAMPGVAAIKDAGFAWEELPLDAGKMRPWKDLRTIVGLVGLYRRKRPGIVHHITVKPVLYGTLAARLARVPRVVNAVSGMGYLFTGQRPVARQIGIGLYRLLMRHPDMRVIVQNTEDSKLFERWKLAPAETLRLIRGSGVDLAQFRPVPPAAGTQVVMQVSRLLVDKGVREFIAAARLVKARYPEARFVLVGGAYAVNPSAVSDAEVRSAVAEGVIAWLGHREDIADLLQQATIACLASYREGLPKSLLEAAACGLPIVTTDTSGCKEVVRHGDNGLLVPVQDAPALAAAIMRLLADPLLCQEMGRRGRKRAEEMFGLGAVIAQQLALYEESALRRRPLTVVPGRPVTGERA
jgi:glycosyltransferase involved in cell wall biosynthesis